MKKKELRAQIRALRIGVEKAVTAEKIGRHDREELLDRLADAGLILVKGPRTQGDRLRAARAGVIVLDDVQLLRSPERTLSQEAPTMLGAYGFLRSIPGPTRAELKLEFTGDPEILNALVQHFHDC